MEGNGGTNGLGTWQNGKAGAPTIIQVPLGTVVRELSPGDSRRSKDEYEAEEDLFEGLTNAEKKTKLRELRWVHYPRSAEQNLERDSFLEAERAMFAAERERKRDRRRRLANPIHLDLDKVEDTVIQDDAPLAQGLKKHLGHLVASGGQGGLGNPHFLTMTNRSPKWATKGQPGERVTLALELKLLADVALVGMPNAGKSTFLRAITGGRAKTEVASYAFTTLNPVVGVVRVADDGTFEGAVQGQMVFDESAVEEVHYQEALLLDGAEDTPTSLRHSRNGAHVQGTSKPIDSEPYLDEHRPGHDFDISETFRFTIADNPGLIAKASENVGLGHSFLRSMERSLALVYVVDLSAREPWEELRILQNELERYQKGMSGKARMVIANKADLLGGDGTDEKAIEEAKAKLKRLEEYVNINMSVQTNGQLQALDVVPVSAKFGQNLKRVVSLLRTYVEEARAVTSQGNSPIHP